MGACLSLSNLPHFQPSRLGIPRKPSPGCGAAWAKTHPLEATRLVAQDHRLTAEALESRFPNLIEGLQLDLNPDKIDTLRRQKDFYLRHGFIAKDFDTEAWVNPRPLEAARLRVEKRVDLKPSIKSPHLTHHIE